MQASPKCPLTRFTLFLIIAFNLAPAILSAGTFSVISLGSLNGNDATATGINSNGTQTVGYGIQNGLSFIAATSAGTLNPLGYSGQANAVNDSGQIVGTNGSTQAFVYQNGSMTTLNYLAGQSSWATGINDAGLIVGAGTTVAGQTVATYWKNGTAYQIGLLGGSFSSAYGVNANGEVAGTSQVPNGAMAAFTWSSGGAMHNLGTLGGVNSYGAAINDSGWVVGDSQIASGYTHAFLWNGTAMVDLGTLGGANSYATGISDAGQIVGWSQTASGQMDAFIYENGVMYDLNSLLPIGSGWNISMANGIDANGDIVGIGTDNGVQYAVELADPPTANPLSVSPAPEPTSALLMGLGLLGIAFVIHRTRTAKATQTLRVVSRPTANPPLA